MAFIPIDARADIDDSKKGKLTPAQHAQLNAWCLANKTGILDWGSRCESTSSSYAIINNEATVFFGKGYIAICGRLVECESGTEVTLQSLTNGERGWIVAKYDLTATGAGEFSVVQKKSTEGALIQQDLNDNPITGKYEFALYNYEVIGNNLALTRTGDYVPDIGGKLEQFEEDLTAEGKPLNGYDTTKGTIEERLTDLGFKTGNITNVSDGSLNGITLQKQGKFAIIRCEVPRSSASARYQSFDMYVDGNPLKADETYDARIPFYVQGSAYAILKFTQGSNHVVYDQRVTGSGTIYGFSVGFKVQ